MLKNERRRPPSGKRKPAAAKREGKKKHHGVRAEKERMTELGSRSYERISEVTPYRTAGKTMHVGDLKLLRMKAIINRIGDQLTLGLPQRDAALYLFQKVRKSMAIADYDVVGLALSYVAGLKQGRTQKINRFTPEGKRERAIFKRYVEKLGGRQSKPVNEVAVMARANEMLTARDLPALDKTQVHEAFVHGSGLKYPEAWVIIYGFAKLNNRWNNRMFGLTEEEFASMVGDISLDTVRGLFNRALAIHGRARRWQGTSNPPSEDEIIARSNVVLRGLGLPSLKRDQIKDAIEHSPPVENPVSWVIVYHFALSPDIYTFTRKGITRVRLAKALGVSEMTVYNLFNQARSRLGKAKRWKSFAP